MKTPKFTPETGHEAEGMSLKSTLVASIAVFGLSLAALLLLGRFLGIAPGSPFSHELNVLFAADAGFRWEQLSDPGPLEFEFAHLFMRQIWGRVGAALAWPLGFVWPADSARFLAATGMVCAVAAAGFASLAFCALRLNPRRWNLLLLSPVCLLFTSNTLIVQPDHLGLTFGLLSAASLALLPSARDITRASLLGVTGFLSGVTTLTNGLYPVLAAAVAFRDRLTLANAKRFRHAILAVAAVGALIFIPVAARHVPVLFRQAKSPEESRVRFYLNTRLVDEPLNAARFAGSGLLYPAVGPTPSIWRRPDDPNNQSHQSYETSRLSDYAPLSAVAACAWVVLLAASSLVVVRSPDLRNYSYALFGWIAFNLLFHNIWGDEFFLFSAHWSWALILIVLLGSRGLPTWAVALAAALIIPGQLSTLSTIRQLIFA